MISIYPGICLYKAKIQECFDANDILDGLRFELAPTQKSIKFGGRSVLMPRLTSWHGDENVTYEYSGVRNIPEPWTPTLLKVKGWLDEELDTKLNSCLVNRYANGKNSIGWHSDNEHELHGRIVSVSIGQAREFWIRRNNLDHNPISVLLEHGDVLTMTVESQKRYQHAVLKDKTKNERWNLTYRTVMNLS